MSKKENLKAKKDNKRKSRSSKKIIKKYSVKYLWSQLIQII